MKIYKNAVFHSCEEENRTFSVMVEHKGRIAYTGDTLPKKYSLARHIDLKGRTVIPAFADTHMHFESYATFLGTVDVREVQSFEQMRQKLCAYAKTKSARKFVLAYGCSAHTVKEKRLPTKKELDEMLTTPLLLVKYDGHAAVANSALIRQFPDEVVQDEGFDADSGWLYQNAFYKGVNFITAKVPPHSLLASMQKASHALASKGISYVHTTEGVGYKNDLDIDTLRAVRYGLAQHMKIFFQTTDVEQVTRRKLKQIGGCFKLALDGCLGSKDAAVSGGYADEPQNEGFLLYTQEEINDFCIRANRKKLQIALHAIGDVAVQQALNAYAAALADFPREDHRHIIIHADLIPPHMIARAAEMGIYIALQPNFLRWPQEPPEYLEEILGERAAQMLPLRSLVDAGVLISAGSDAPCTLPSPIMSIYNACNHPASAQSLTPEQALKMHTLWAAKSAFDEKERGSLEVGKVADFVVLSGDPLDMPTQKLKNLHIIATYLGGKLHNPFTKLSLPRLLARVIGGRITKGKEYSS